MFARLLNWGSIDGIPYVQWGVRLVWLAVQLLLVLWFGQQGSAFYYQGF